MSCPFAGEHHPFLITVAGRGGFPAGAETMARALSRPVQWRDRL